ncbi:hypothetical protein [Bifidobacterium pullorum]|nr:hypothetical protein [Bifidobacterium pullorum]
MTQTTRRPLLATMATGITLAMVLAGGMAASAAEPSPTAGIA